MGSAACVPLENAVPGKGFNEVSPRSVLGTEKSQELRNCELVVLSAWVAWEKLSLSLQNTFLIAVSFWLPDKHGYSFFLL